MEIGLTHLPDDVETLRNMAIGYKKKYDDLKKEADEKSRNYEVENNLLRDLIRLLRQKIYGRKSEQLGKYGADDGSTQLLLFADLDQGEEQKEEERVKEISVTSHKRKKGGRKPLPEHLERQVVEHVLSGEDLICECGCEMTQIGQEVSEQLESRPSLNWVVQNIRYKYACKKCQGLESGKGKGSVRTAPMPPQILPKSGATASLAAQIVIGKYEDALPFYRQEQQFKRIKVDISRETMCKWAIKVAQKCQPLVDLFRESLLFGPLIQIDETTMQVLKEADRPAERKSYMWLFRGGPPGKKVVLYRYHPGRGGEVAADFLGEYKGYVQTDGYSGYNFLDKRPGVVHVGCWAHVRRKFMEVLQASGAGKHGDRSNKALGKAGKAVRMIGELYAIESQARGLCSDEVYRLRQERSRPIVEELGAWLREISLTVPPKSLLGRAIMYALGQWARLVRYLEDGCVGMDNNLAENAIRPFVVGRKNWLFADQPAGARASATLYSLIGTAKANGLEPYKYLFYLFSRLPYAESPGDYKKLLPYNLDSETLEKHYSENSKPA